MQVLVSVCVKASPQIVVFPKPQGPAEYKKNVSFFTRTAMF